MYHDELIYRAERIINWCPRCLTALSDIEVEHSDDEGELVSISYGPVTVATTRVETMLGDTAVAVHPEDERYRHLIGTTLTLPLVGREIPVVADEHVDPEFGTGALKITPGHDPNDFEIGRANGLEEISVIGEDGRMTEAAGERYAGLTAAEAQERVVEDLRAEGRLRGEEPYTHSVPFSHRSGERIEPLISLQWFCRMDDLAAPAIEVVESDEVSITPDQWKRVYLDWMRNIRPWCVSRQLWWGHRIPVWYCDACEETYVAEEPPRRCGACDGELRQDPDVLDTWFSSALWPFATLGWPDDTPEMRTWYPTDFLTTARDIIFLWVARMIMSGLEFAGSIPFRDVYVHSVIQARDGRRMSKSLGTGIDPLEEIDVHGADALRFGLLAMSSTQDVRYSDAKVEQGRDLANKMWNASRLILLNAPEGIGADAAANPELPEDRWITSRLETTIRSVTGKLEAYDFAHAAQDVYAFFWSELCDWYLEIAKPRLYDGDERAAATLLRCLERTLALAHPMMPFITEEIWAHHPWREGHLCVHPFPEADTALIDEAAEAEVGAAIDMTRSLRAWRDLVQAPAAAVLPARAEGAEPPQFVGRLARFDFAAGEGETLASVGSVRVLASDAVDAESVSARIEKRREELRGEVKRAEGKLSNERFVAKAPPEVVEEERTKLDRYRAELESLENG
jgi:valyl-tRNA synthetase